ncbi:MAG: hypothetical protein J6W04_00190 [Bacteroidales bacterium]|nr:hypothetical protein [Bacteroidales bacterium]
MASCPRSQRGLTVQRSDGGLPTMVRIHYLPHGSTRAIVRILLWLNPGEWPPFNKIAELMPHTNRLD